jgi:trehalose synthase
MIHDPQPLAMMPHLKKGKAKWIWRCHIDTTTAPKAIWDYLLPFINLFDGSVYSLPDYSPKLSHPMFIIAPSINPSSEKNCDIPEKEIQDILTKYKIDSQRPILIQVSRFDHFKDPIGVINAYKIAKKYAPTLQLILVGGGATDDPEGTAVLKEVEEVSLDEPDIFVLNIAADAHRTINALQRAATIVIQKSIKEGFGLTVTEALFKAKPVIAGNTGGIRIQVIDRHTGLLVNTPEGAAMAIGLLLENTKLAQTLGQTGQKHVIENFLMDRELREYLSMMASLHDPQNDHLNLPSIK